MNSRKNLAASVAAALAVAALSGASAFADDRHSNATERDRDRQTYERRDDSRDNRGGDWRNESRSGASARGGDYRGDSRNDRSYNNNDARGRSRMAVQGRVTRLTHERGGYRVFVDGGRYPVWIPEARFSLFPGLRVGVSINIGGYYDPYAGYVEAYDYYGGPAAYDSRLLRGYVEDIDYRRGVAYVRDDYSRRVVTVVLREYDLRRLRRGDFAELSGDWTRGGAFEAYRLEDVRGRRW